MTDDARTLPDARAMAIIGLALSLARSPDQLADFGRVNAEALRSLDPPTLAAARAVYARRMGELRRTS